MEAILDNDAKIDLISELLPIFDRRHCYDLKKLSPLLVPSFLKIKSHFSLINFGLISYSGEKSKAKVEVFLEDSYNLEDILNQFFQFLDHDEPLSFYNDIGIVFIPIKRGPKVVGSLYLNGINKEDINFFRVLAHSLGHLMHQWNKAFEVRKANNNSLGPYKVNYLPKDIIGRSKKMLEVFSLMEKLKDSSTTALLLGESGAGKEKIAQGIHKNGLRSEKPLISVNCAALPKDLIESELFGHEKGSFTGASSLRIGRFEAANGGTLFLDEIGDLPMHTQVKLLRVLQERKFERVGGNRPIDCDLQIIAATHKNLEKLVEKGLFRADLYYRLNVFPIRVPSLRERKEDILSLADFFIDKFNQLNNKSVKRLSTSAIDMLMKYHWPGNVRELSNCIERAVLLCDGGVILGSHLPPTLQTPESSGTVFSGELETHLSQIEKDLICDALKSTNGNISKAANQLGLTERKMGLRVRKFELNPSRFKVLQ